MYKCENVYTRKLSNFTMLSNSEVVFSALFNLFFLFFILVVLHNIPIYMNVVLLLFGILSQYKIYI